jgi:ribose transport system substrate-binding protein
MANVFAQEAWDGPTTGPKAAEGKTIVVLAADMKNGGILGVTTGIEEAAAKIGWDVRVLDGAGSVQSRTAAVGSGAGAATRRHRDQRL